MWIGDVGQSTWEEIDHTSAGAPGGVNYGWRCYEGNDVFNSTGCSGTYTFPVYVYPNPNGSSSPPSAVTGGKVYRGTLMANTALQGYYLAADFYSGNIYKIKPDGTVFIENAALTNIADFGMAENGELYAVSLNGTVYSISVGSVLPLVLSQFTAVSHNGVAQLNWKTSSEEGLQQFEIEYSLHGNDFTRAGIVPAKNSPSGAAYEFNQVINYSASIYYRLKMVDFDGSYHYSNVIVVFINKQNTNFVYPSVITTGILNMFINEPFTSVELLSMNGAIVLKMDITGRIGNLAIPVYAAAGTYIVQLKNHEKTLLQRIIIR